MGMDCYEAKAFFEIYIKDPSEVRQVLERVNPLRTIGTRKFSAPDEWISGFAKAIFSLVARRIFPSHGTRYFCPMTEFRL